VNRSEIEDEVLKILKDCALGSSTRQITLDQPLGDSGLGFDSLALVGFLTSVENTFDIEIPESIWTQKERTTLRHFVDLIDEHGPAEMKSASEPQVNCASGRVRLIARVLSRAARSVFLRRTFIVLSRDLDDIDTAAIQTQNDLILREISADDLAALPELWPREQRKKQLKVFESRRKSGFICLVAVRRGEIVGMDWLSASGDQIAEMGVTITTRNGACYALDLYEKYSGQGIGLALLEYSLIEAKRRGFRKQVTYTYSSNEQMLRASIYLFGFKRIGTVQTMKLLSRRFPRLSLMATQADIHIA
jgi:acyl carrier protein/GNAT superfamily N-acetyltransferase